MGAPMLESIAENMCTSVHFLSRAYAVVLCLQITKKKELNLFIQ